MSLGIPSGPWNSCSLPCDDTGTIAAQARRGKTADGASVRLKRAGSGQASLFVRCTAGDGGRIAAALAGVVLLALAIPLACMAGKGSLYGGYSVGLGPPMFWVAAALLNTAMVLDTKSTFDVARACQTCREANPFVATLYRAPQPVRWVPGTPGLRRGRLQPGSTSPGQAGPLTSRPNPDVTSGSGRRRRAGRCATRSARSSRR
jgi:hypothetical protein